MATLHAGFSQVKGTDRSYGMGIRLTDIEADLRARFATGSPSVHKHDGTSGDGSKVPFSNLGTPPTGITGGARHSKTAHATVPLRVKELPLDNWKMAAGTALGIVSSVTLPYFSWSSAVQRITWPANVVNNLQQQIVVPDNFATAVDSQRVALLIRSTAAGTQTEMTSSLRQVIAGSNISGALSPATVALATAQTTPEKVTMALTYQTLNQKDILSVQLAPSGNNTGANVVMFGSYLEYTAEE